jgi:hypothetical protein
LIRSSIIFFGLASMLPAAILLGWPNYFCGVGTLALLGSPVFLILAVWEAVRYGRSWRVLVAGALSLVATIIGWSTIVLFACGKLSWQR